MVQGVIIVDYCMNIQFQLIFKIGTCLALFVLQETQGVTVATFGPNRDFPAFFTPNSGVQSPINVTNAREAAELIGVVQSLL